MAPKQDKKGGKKAAAHEEPTRKIAFNEFKLANGSSFFFSPCAVVIFFSFAFIFFLFCCIIYMLYCKSIGKSNNLLSPEFSMNVINKVLTLLGKPTFQEMSATAGE